MGHRQTGNEERDPEESGEAVCNESDGREQEERTDESQAEDGASSSTCTGPPG